MLRNLSLLSSLLLALLITVGPTACSDDDNGGNGNNPTPDATPDPTPSPMMTPAGTPDATPDATPMMTPDGTPPATPMMTPMATPDDTMPPEIPDDVALAEVPALLAGITCARMAECAPITFNDLGGGAGCKAGVEANIVDSDFASLQQAITDATVTYDGGAMSTCMSGLVDLPCAQEIADLIDGGNQVDVPDCEGVFTGSVAAGGDCVIDEVCTGDAVCIHEGTCPGACTDPAAAGEDCSDDDGCADDLVCHEGSCTAPLAEDAECDDDSADCETGFICLGADEDNAVKGACRPVAEAFDAEDGEACGLEAGTLCGSGLYCSLVTDTCKPRVALGEACDVGVLRPCERGAWCERAGETQMGTCVALPGEGEACGRDFIIPRCAPRLVCVGFEFDVDLEAQTAEVISAGTCRAPKAAGEACADDAECRGDCDEDAGTCRSSLDCRD